MFVQCVTCGGVYAPLSRDGVAYFHHCAPVPDADGTAVVERPHARNENVTVDRATGRVAPIAIGQGVTPAAAPRPVPLTPDLRPEGTS